MTTVPPGPFVLDVRDPGRRVGHQKHVHATVIAPDDIGTAVIGVLAGSDIELDLTLQAVGEGILVMGTAEVPIAGECSRCLADIRYTEDVELAALYCYPPTDSRGRALPVSEDSDDETLWVADDHVDLEGPLTDAVVLGLPLAPLCQPDCPGLCPQCGVPLAEAPGHEHPAYDPRWQALATLSQPSEPDEPEVKED